MDKPNKTTRQIAGHPITLLDGVRYVATCPMVLPQGGRITVIIQPMLGAPLEAEEAQIEGLTCEEAKHLIGAFSKGPTPFDGRVW